jgi:hypothetical protein
MITREELKAETLNGFDKLLNSWLITAKAKKIIQSWRDVIESDDRFVDLAVANFNRRYLNESAPKTPASDPDMGDVDCR